MLADAEGVAVAVELLSSTGLHEKIKRYLVTPQALEHAPRFVKEIFVYDGKAVDVVLHAGLLQHLPNHRLLGGLAVVDSAAYRIVIVLVVVGGQQGTAVLNDNSRRPVAEPHVVLCKSTVLHAYHLALFFGGYIIQDGGRFVKVWVVMRPAFSLYA